MTDIGKSNPRTIAVAALYRFAKLADCEGLRAPLQKTCDELGVFGTLLLAPEGINGTIAGNRGAIDAVLRHIRKIPGLEETSTKESHATKMPFLRMKVRLKREIVTMGQPDIDPLAGAGTYVEPQDWNDLISDPDVILIDTRNDYEVAIGTFKGAVDPATETFREFPGWTEQNLPRDRNQKIAMFCTGGIRCEKATAYLKSKGYEDVFHLKGGILKYLEQIDPAESLWQGECFVFDRRVSVGHGLKPGPYQLCSICRQPLLSGHATGGGYSTRECDTCANTASETQRQRAAQRQMQIELARSRGASHLGPAQKNANK